MTNPSVSLPQNLDAEIGVLGALLIEESIAGEVFKRLDKSYFSSQAHQLIFEAIGYLFEKSKPIDPVSVMEELKRQGVLDQVGGQEYLFSLMGAVYSAGNAIYYADVVREKGIMRSLIGASQQIIEYTKSENIPLETLLDKSEQLIFEVTQKKVTSEPVHINHILIEVVASLEKESTGITGLPSGFYDLDQMTSGLQPSNLIILAARPSMGKTSFALNIACNVAVEQNVGVLLFSLEMSKEQLAQNMVCSRSKVSAHKITNGSISQEDYDQITTEASSIGNAPIFIDDTPGLSLRELRGKARRYKAQYKIGLIVIDYIQLMESPEIAKNENRQQEISQISRGLKGIARELKIPIIALSQLNRSVDARDDHRPRMSDLRESGALEQDADLIMFLYRDDYYNHESQHQGMAELIVAKHRNGPTGTVNLYFFKQYMRFVSSSNQKNTNENQKLIND
ncbi:MAG: replicative DNA helicase [Candidatus Brocadiae bacterium]|nr:replicative DNA helicase [Candidatus Brocadiia bacterium]